MNVASLSLRALFHGGERHSATAAAGGRRDRRRRTSAGRTTTRRGGLFEQLEARQLLTVNVTTLADSDTGSLRAAINAVNLAAVADTIVFSNLGTGTIALTSALPPLTNPAGTTFSFSNTTAIILDGAAAGGADGLTIASGANTVSMNGINLTITNFDSGLRLAGGSTNSTFKGLTITNNATGIELVGGSLTGTVIAGNVITLNSQTGIYANGGVTSLTIGGTTAGTGNTIAYNGDGLVFLPGTYTSTLVAGNTIYLNSGNGLQLGTSGGTLGGLVIGGSAAAANTINYNKENGVEVAQGDYTGTLLQGNTISSNGGYGVQLSPAGQTLSNLTIGGLTTGQGNTIASNAADGIGIFGGTYTGTVVQGNTIQYNQNNGVNINLFAGGGAFSGLVLGGDATGAGNTINANGLDGVQVNAGNYSKNTFVQGNTITSNGRNGVNFYAPFGEKINGLQLGGTTSALGNTVTGNAASGLAASKGDYTDTTVQGNTFSTNLIGISLSNTQNLNVGGVATAFKNTISSNTQTGLFATGNLAGTYVQGNALTGNTVGVSLQDAQSLSLGSAAAGGGNTITGGVTGLRAVGNMSGSLIAGNAITGQTTGIELVNATAVSGQPFFVGGAATTVGNGVGNYVASTVHGLYAAGSMTNTTIGGNIFSASAVGGNAMVLVNTTGLTVGGSAAGIGNTLTAAQGNGLFAAGLMTGTGFYRNTLTASTNGAVLSSARNFLFGVANNSALGNIVQYNKLGVLAVGACNGSGVCYTTWLKNTAKISNRATGLIVYPKA